jgi:hypothetical protein
VHTVQNVTMTALPAELREHAYEVWCGDGAQSAKKTAELCGVSVRSIQMWQKADEWRQRWMGEHASEAEVAAAQGKQMLRAATPLMVKRLLHIIGAEVPLRTGTGAIIRNDAGEPIMTYAASDKDAVGAMKLGLLYSLGTPLSATDVGDGSVLTASYHFPEPAGPKSEPGEESVAELRQRASAMLEATVAAVNTRTSSTTQRRKRV